MGRRTVAIVATVLTGLLIQHAGRAVYRSVYDHPTGTWEGDCAAGIRRAHEAYEAVWDARRSGAPNARVRPELEAEFRALRVRCAREGEGATRAYTPLARWRYRSESLTRLWTDTLTDDAERALGFTPPPGSQP